MGNGKKITVEKNVWNKRSTFFDLLYWKFLFVRHCLDVMHVEKNAYDSIICTLLNITGKTNDSVKVRKDLVEMGIHKQLAPEQKGQNTFLLSACYTLSRKKKINLCQCLSEIKVPSGYSSNI